MFNILTKKTQVPDTKSVDYFGLTLKVPTWTKFITTDADGDILTFNHNPVIGDYLQWDSDYSDTLPDQFERLEYYIETVKFEGDWKESLTEIEDEF